MITICFYLQMSMTLAVADGHLVNMGKMIEEMEGKLRNSLDQVQFCIDNDYAEY